jgi:hypothetical protein
MLAQTLSTNGLTTVYTVPNGKSATFSVSMCNTGTTVTEVVLAIGNGVSPTTANTILYATLDEKSSIERTALRADEGDSVFVTTTNADIAISIYGFEE